VSAHDRLRLVPVAHGDVAVHVYDASVAGSAAPAPRPLVALHGFLGSGRDWAELAPRLAAGRTLLAVDLPGHGATRVHAVDRRLDMSAAASAVLAVLDAMGAADCDLLGYSMGGRVALYLAALAPVRVRRLVLESASPGMSDPVLGMLRALRDERAADRLERDGLEAFVDRWERLPLFASQLRLPDDTRLAQRRSRLAGDARSLAAVLRGMGGARQPWLGNRLTTLEAPTLFVAGALDRKYVRIGRMVAGRVPDARLVVVEGAGHNVHLEARERFVDAVVPFLAGEGARPVDTTPGVALACTPRPAALGAGGRA
jgi:2-succinyl-6-hydroxy-2,4-cyclohexadiene-1-carboxylate synthase